MKKGNSTSLWRRMKNLIWFKYNLSSCKSHYLLKITYHTYSIISQKNDLLHCWPVADLPHTTITMPRSQTSRVDYMNNLSNTIIIQYNKLREARWNCLKPTPRPVSNVWIFHATTWHVKSSTLLFCLRYISIGHLSSTPKYVRIHMDLGVITASSGMHIDWFFWTKAGRERRGREDYASRF